MVVRPAPDHFHAVERALQQVERLPVGLLHFFLKILAGSQIADAQHRRARGADHLQRAFLAGQKRDPQRLLPLDHPLERGFALLRRDRALDLDDAANVIRGIRHRDRRVFPQFALRQRDRLEAGFPAFQPCLELCSHVLCHQ